MKIAVFLPNWVGDAVMSTPALRLLRSCRPVAEIVGIVRTPVESVLDGLGLVDRVLPYEPRKPSSPHRGLAWIRQFRREKFDEAVLLTNSLHTALLAWLGGATRRIGADRDGRGWLLTDRVPFPNSKLPHPVVRDYLAIAQQTVHPGLLADLPTLAAPPRLEAMVTLAEQNAWNEFWEAQPCHLRYRPLVCLNTGGAFGPAKNWPLEQFAALALRLVLERECTVVVLCGPAERENAARIAELAHHPAVLSLAHLPPNLGRTKAAIGAASLLVTTDSGPRHFAVALGTPVITLFGPTDPAWSESWSPLAIHLQEKMDCGPCQQRACPLGHHRCMHELSVDRVFAVAEARLRTTQLRRNTA